MKVTKRSTFTGDFDVSEQQAEPISGESGSVGAGPAAPNSSDTQGEPVAASMQGPVEGSIEGSTRVESPKLAPEQGAAEEMPKVDPPKVLAGKTDVEKAETSKAETSKAETSKAEIPTADAPRIPGRVMIMSAGERSWSGDRSWSRNDAGPAPESEPNSGIFGKRRLGALAAVVALAAVAGALGGAVATASLRQIGGDNTASVANHALEASVARLDADIQALKVGADHASKLGMTQFNKTSERLDKVEKAQLEPAAKLAKLSEAVEKLHATPPAAAAAAAAAKETTGSISPPPAAAAAAPKVEVARLPTVEGWSLRDVADGGALIEGRQGIFEVYAGDPVPGLGRIDAIRRQDGHWVVVTSKGLIVAR
jgi:hypothetical protein